jgi:hypothetical protein
MNPTAHLPAIRNHKLFNLINLIYAENEYTGSDAKDGSND